MTRPLGYIDFELYRKAIDELSETGAVTGRDEMIWLHHFGESLLHPEFDACIRYASGKGIRTGLSINPIMLNDTVSDKLLESSPHILIVSLDGHDDESFLRIRGIKNAYETSKERFLIFLRKKTVGRSKIIVILSMIDFDLNRHSIELARTCWKSLPGIDGFLEKNFTNWDGSAPDVNDLMGNRKNLNHERIPPMCTWPWKRMTITWDGDVVPCCFDYNKKYVLGNIKDSTLLEIWNGVKLEQLRNELSSNNVQNSLCRNCRRFAPSQNLTET